MECILIFVTCSSEGEAKRISSKLLEEHLAACVSIVKHVESFFHWQGKVDQVDEVLLSIKTRHDLFDAVRHAVKELHSYDVPEIIAVNISDGNPEYLAWISESVTCIKPFFKK